MTSRLFALSAVLFGLVATSGAAATELAGSGCCPLCR